MAIERPYDTWQLPRPARMALLVLAGAALLAGLTGALALIGTPLPPAGVALAGRHGVLMTLGFLGTLIALERAVALGRPWAYVAPLVTGIGGLALLFGAPVAFTAAAFTLGGLLLVAMYVAFARVAPSFHGAVEAAGAGAWVVAAILLAIGLPTSAVVPWLSAFLVLTVMGERLELSAILRPSGRVRAAFALAVETYVIGVTLTLLVPELGARLMGLGLLAIAGWALRFDLARRTIRATGVTRFIAACLLVGYGWLVVAGATWAIAGPVTAGAAYDAALHAVFLGFVISMVFGHAPVILPGVLRIPLPYHPVFYGHLALLHAGLAIRIVGGDLLGVPGAWTLGGTLSVVAILVFVAVSVGSAVLGLLRSSRPHRQPERSRRS